MCTGPDSDARPFAGPYVPRLTRRQSGANFVLLLTRLQSGAPRTEWEAFAREIVAAVNNYADLLAACEFAARIFGGHSGRSDDPITEIEFGQRLVALDQLQAAIRQARGQ